MAEKDKRINFLINAAVIVVIIALFYVCVKYLLQWLLPFVVALIIALIIRRPIDFLVRKTHVNKKVVAPVLTTLFVLIILGLVVLIVAKLIGELTGFVSNLPKWYDNIIVPALDRFAGLFGRFVDDLPSDIYASVVDITDQFSDYLKSAVSSIAKSGISAIASFASGIPSILVGIIISAVATYFIAGKTDRLRDFALRVIPESKAEATGVLYVTFAQSVGRMVRAYLLIMLITFLELTVALAILGVDYFYIIAAITAIVDVLPVLGTGTILIPWAVINLILGNYKLGIGLLIVYALITIIRQIIEPKIVSKHIGLPSLVTLMGMYVGLRVFGILGMFLVPLTMILVKSANDTGVIHLWRPAPDIEGTEVKGGKIAKKMESFFRSLFSAIAAFLKKVWLWIKGLFTKTKK